MVTYYPELADKVRSQGTRLPDLYGELSFTEPPFRLTTDPGVHSALPSWIAARAPYLENPRLVELISTATLLGDIAADSYAALAATHSVSHLIDMLRTACREGIDAVPEAPTELAEFIAAMEDTPD